MVTEADMDFYEKMESVIEEELGDVGVPKEICIMDFGHNKNGTFDVNLEFEAGFDKFSIPVHFDGSWSDFVSKFCDFAEGFDPKKHVERYIPFMGKDGIPTSEGELLKDANSIRVFLQQWAGGIKKAQYDKDWDKLSA